MPLVLIAVHGFETSNTPARPVHRRADPAARAIWSNSLFFGTFLACELRPDQLQNIAESDYGVDATGHLRKLQRIVTERTLERELAWEPHEVLSLSRWTVTPSTDHEIRAFASVVLLLASAEESWEHGLAGLTESALVLGGDIVTAARPFVAWLATVTEDPEQRALATLAGALLANDPARARQVLENAGLRETLATAVTRDAWERLLASALG